MNSYFVLTGAPGSGKTTVSTRLKRLGLAVVDEPARRILAEQRSIGGRGIPDRDPDLFTQLLLSRALSDYHTRRDRDVPLLFDRGLPDVVGYAELLGAPADEAATAAGRYRYSARVFWAPLLEGLYRRDDERTMIFEEARDFGSLIRRAYERRGYQLVELPHGTPDERARFILAQMLDASSA